MAVGPRGPLLVVSDEVLFRHIIAPWMVPEGELSSQAFRPSKVDEGMMSVDRSSKTTAEAAHALALERRQNAVAVYGLTIREFAAEQLNAYEDEEPGPPPNPAHALVDYRLFERKVCERKSKVLYRVAVARGVVLARADAAPIRHK